MWNIPNLLTLFRIVIIPFFLLCFLLDFPYSKGITVTLFILAAITDWFDGYLARKWKQTTKLGAFLDPVADKLMVAVALVAIVSAYPFWWVTVPACIIISREIIVSALREWMAEIGQRAVVKVSYIGKVKTALQMISMVILLYKPSDLKNIFVIISFIILYIAVFITIYSMYAYLKAAHKAFKESESV